MPSPIRESFTSRRAEVGARPHIWASSMRATSWTAPSSGRTAQAAFFGVFAGSGAGTFFVWSPKYPAWLEASQHDQLVSFWFSLAYQPKGGHPCQSLQMEFSLCRIVARRKRVGCIVRLFRTYIHADKFRMGWPNKIRFVRRVSK